MLLSALLLLLLCWSPSTVTVTDPAVSTAAPLPPSSTFGCDCDSAAALSGSVQDHNNNTTKTDKPGGTTATARGPPLVGRIKRRIRRLKPAKLAKIFAALAPQDQPDAASAESLQWLFKKFGSDEAGVRAAMRELSAQGDDVLSLASLVGWAKRV